MIEQLSRPTTLLEDTRNFIDSEFLSHVDSKDFKMRKSHILQNTGITPAFVRDSYRSYLTYSTDYFLDSGKALQRDSTNLALLKVMNERLHVTQRVITPSDELSLFRNSLIAEMNAKMLNIESHTAEHGNFEDIDYSRDFPHGEIKSLNRLILMETLIPPSATS